MSNKPESLSDKLRRIAKATHVPVKGFQPKLIKAALNEAADKLDKKNDTK